MRRFVLGILFAGFLVVTFGVSEIFAQRAGESRDKIRIELAKDARQNGYEVSKKRGKIYVHPKNVVDPLTKKRLEGLQELEFRCKDPDPVQTLVNIMFKNGSTPKPLLIICEDIEGEALATLVVNRLR